MTLLEQKLEQLSLTTMSQQLEQAPDGSSDQNLSLPQPWNRLSISNWKPATPRRRAPLPLSRLHAQHSIDTFHFQHHKSRLQSKNRILRLLDLDFLDNGTNVVLIGNPGVGKTFLAKIIGWRACQANQRVLFTTAMDMLNHLLASQVDHSLVRKLKLYTEPALLICDELGYLVARSADFQPVLSGHLDAPRPRAAPSSLPTPPSPNGATSSTTPPSPPPSPIAWWRTPKSFCSEATAFAKPKGPAAANSHRLDSSRRRSVR